MPTEIEGIGMVFNPFLDKERLTDHEHRCVAVYWVIEKMSGFDQANPSQTDFKTLRFSVSR